MAVAGISALYPSTINTSGSVSSSAAASAFSDALGTAVNMLSAKNTTTLENIFASASEKYGVPENLLKAVAKAESGFSASAISSCGAEGIMQLMPSTASSLGVKNSFNPEQNIMGGAKLLSQLLKKYNGNTELALAAYNAGSGAVDKYDGIPPYKETQNYVKKVMTYMGESLSVPGTKVTSSDSVSSTSSYSDTVNFYRLLAAEIETDALNGSESTSGTSLGNLNALLGTGGLSSDLSGSEYSSLLSILTGSAGGTASSVNDLETLLSLEALQTDSSSESSWNSTQSGTTDSEASSATEAASKILLNTI